MRYLWTYWLPLLFLPNLGFETETQFGTLTVSDYFIGPYIILMFLRGQLGRSDRFKPAGRLYVHYLIPTFFVFLWWALLSTLTIYLRYDYPDLIQTYFSLLKLGKLSLYGLAAILTIRALSKTDEREFQRFLWAMLASGVLVGLTLLMSGNALENILPSLPITQRGQVFQENPTSAMMAMLIVFIVGMIIAHNGTLKWYRIASIGLIIMVLGFLFAEGRGGWLAAIAGMFYISSRINLKQTMGLALAGIALIAFAYSQFPSFKEAVDRTIHPDPVFIATYRAGILGIDTIDAGARPRYWAVEASKILYSPLLGTGFFHRGGNSGLDPVGSHNFYIQMFLETGIPGGVLILVMLRQMWLHASTECAKKHRLNLPVKATLVAAVVSGLSGEYFYGGMVLFTLLLLYAPVGCITIQPDEAGQSLTPIPQIP